MLKVRDMFDISVVDVLFPELLRGNLPLVVRLKAAILGRLNSVSEEYLRHEIDELDIMGDWKTLALSCRDRAHELVAAIPD